MVTPLAGSVAGLIAALAFVSAGLAPEAQAESKARSASPAKDPPKAEAPAAPRSADESLRVGLEYLIKQQQSDGGWGQGGGWRQSREQGGGRVEGANVEDPPDLGNTSVSLVTLLRASQEGQREAIRKAFEFICRQVEGADEASLYVTAVRDTQLQVKIGVYVDTFLAGWALSELKGRFADDDAAEKRRAAALDKVVSKIERNQRADGSFDGNKGWAAVLSQGLCSKALNSAARSGAKVSTDALAKDQRQNLDGLDVARGDFSATTGASEPSSAGVSLYREASKLGGLRERAKSNVPRKAEAEKTLADASAPAPAKAKAREEIKQIAGDEQAAQVAQTAVAGKLGDSRYVAGFGNNGGEEFLSYLNLGESMHEQGGKAWEDWKGKMQATLCSAQNEDGSWAGQHCITGRTFCTSAALLTLLVERVPAGAAIGSVDSGKTVPVATAATTR
ncbi:MAG: hypothetical protein QOE70_6012 [Chthoniobacter sp.]|nr:hypothetical protein [Chthoniobacter sp.]